MDISYRRTPPSILERALARLAKRRSLSSPLVAQVDLVHDFVVVIIQPTD